DHRHGGGAGLAVAVVVGDGQRHGVRADVGAIEAGAVQTHAGNAAGTGAAAVVDLFRGNGGVAGSVQLSRQVPADRHRRLIHRVDCDQHRGDVAVGLAVIG